MQTYENQLNADLQWALREGSMHFEGESAVHKTLRRICKRLDELDIDYAIAGGMALFFHGYRRFTEDVDVLVTRDGLAKLHEHLEGRGYLRPFEKSENLRDTVTGVKIDFLVAGGYPGDGKPGPVAFPIPADVSIESDGVNVLNLKTVIEMKLASGQASHRAGDLNDVQRLIQSLQLPQEFAEKVSPSLRDAFLGKWDDAQKAAGEDV
jgi:hypothetical protein